MDPCAINPVPDQKPLAERRKSRVVGRGTNIFHELLAAASAKRSGKTRPSDVYTAHAAHNKSSAHTALSCTPAKVTNSATAKRTSFFVPKHACVFCGAFFLFLCCLSVGRVLEGDA